MSKTYAAAHSGIQYFGNWVYDGTRRYTSIQYSRCIFTFTGNSVRVYFNTRPDGGMARIYVDGAYQATVNTENSENLKQMLFEKTDISGDKIHEITVVSEKVKARPNAVLEVWSFEADALVNYAEYMRDLKLREYDEIARGVKKTSDPKTWKKVAYKATFPQGGVKIRDRIFTKMMADNNKIIKYDFSVPFYCDDDGADEIYGGVVGPGWSHFLPASNEARLLAGAYNFLLWEEDAELRAIGEKIMADITARMRDDGYFNYYPEAESFDDDVTPFSERKNYDRVFWTRAMLYAHNAGNRDGLRGARKMYNWLENQPQHLSHMVCGTNSTNAYPGLPLMANSEAGEDGDMLTVQKYFDQDYLLKTLADGNSLAVVHYPGHQPHCYALLIIEALADEYRATGEQKYLDALMGGYEIWRKYYIHIGGTAAICEVDGPYPPGSYYITTGHNGETCSSVFWCLINMRLMQLFPGEEKYAKALEESLFNAIAACRTAEDGWTRYHVRFHGEKEWGRNWNNCCEVAATMFIPTVPSYIYSADEQGVFVNLYIASDYTGDNMDISLKTDFPYSGRVELAVTPKSAEEKTLRIRIPEWQTKAVDILINGEKQAEGKPGSYCELKRVWQEQDILAFEFDVSPRLIKYTGDDQPRDNSDRYAMLCGPMLMALTQVEREEVLPLRNRLTIEPTIPRINMSPEKMLQSLQEESPMHYSVDRFKFVPYYAIDKEYFTCYPIIEE